MASARHLPDLEVTLALHCWKKWRPISFYGGLNTGCLQGAPEQNLVCGYHFHTQLAFDGINDANGPLTVAAHKNRVRAGRCDCCLDSIGERRRGHVLLTAFQPARRVVNHIKAGSLEVAGAERNKVFVKPGRVDDRQPFNARAAQSSFGSEASGDSRDPRRRERRRSTSARSPSGPCL